MREMCARAKYIRISPRKARLAAGLIRGRGVEEAFAQLHYSGLKGGAILEKVLKSAVANAEVVHGLQRREIKVREVRIDEGPVMKRAKSKARGGGVPILKRMSHVTICVGD